MNANDLKNFIQSANINFLIGSGLSMPRRVINANISTSVKLLLPFHFFDMVGVVIPSSLDMDSSVSPFSRHIPFSLEWSNCIFPPFLCLISTQHLVVLTIV